MWRARMVRFTRGAFPGKGPVYKMRGNIPSHSKRLSHADGRDLQRLPVLGDGAAGDHDALLAQDLRDLAVRKRFARVLGGDQLLDQGPDRGRGAGAARLGGDVASEEVLELEDAARRKHEFLGGDARYGRFVQAERVGDLAQHQGPHRDLAVLEEVPLPVDDRLRHAQNGFEPLLYVLDQPARFLKLVRQLAAGLAAVVLKDIGVHAVDARHPDVFDLLDDDVGHDVTRFSRRESRAGARVEALDQALGCPQLVVPALQRLLEPREVAG